MPAIRDFEKGYDPCHLAVIREAEERHFWFRERRHRIGSAFLRHVPKSARILEVGSGTGFVAEHLQQLGFAMEASDLYPEALEYLKARKISPLYQFDLLDPPFEGEFDVVALFDVLEHFPDPCAALVSIRRMLKREGLLILTVPAHMWLWSQADVVAGHCQRFTRKSLTNIFLETSFCPIEMRYFFFTLLPLLTLRKGMRQKTFTCSLSPLLNSVLERIVGLEPYLEKVLPNVAGGSLLAVARVGRTR